MIMNFDIFRLFQHGILKISVKTNVSISYFKCYLQYDIFLRRRIHRNINQYKNLLILKQLN